MKATELINELDKLIMKHGDCEVRHEIDFAFRELCTDVSFYKRLDPGDDDAFVINHDRNRP